MAKAEPTKRLHALIDHLDAVQFRLCPTGVGLKTAIRARDLGFVEFDDDEADRWTYRLTDKGAAYRACMQNTHEFVPLFPQPMHLRAGRKSVT